MRSLLFWLLLMTPTMTVALPLARPVAMPIGPGPDRMAAGVARMVGSILEFTRWPTARPVVRMCMAGVVAHGDQLDEISLTNGARIATVALAADEAADDTVHLARPGEAFSQCRLDGSETTRL